MISNLSLMLQEAFAYILCGFQVFLFPRTQIRVRRPALHRPPQPLTRSRLQDAPGLPFPLEPRQPGGRAVELQEAASLSWVRSALWDRGGVWGDRSAQPTSPPAPRALAQSTEAETARRSHGGAPEKAGV